jgi:hypothetical protein
MMLALFVTSCRTVKEETMMKMKTDTITNKSDTVVEERQKLVAIPGETVTLKMATADLKKLPTGAGYSTKKGHVSINVTMKGDSVVVAANTDSIQQVCESYKRTIANLRSAASKEQVKQSTEKHSIGIISAIKWFFIGLLAGVGITILYKPIKKLVIK